MKNNVFMILASISVLGFATACERSENEMGASALQNVKGADISKAVTDISKDGKSIRFTIPEEARAFDDAAQGKVSAVYDSARDVSDDCPKVTSKEISKEVGDYDITSGKATITATFDDQDVADKVYKAGCLIIDDA